MTRNHIAFTLALISSLLSVGCSRDGGLGPLSGDRDTTEVPSTGGPDIRVTTPTTPPDTAEWTVMVYISGDNNLESYVVTDIEDELAVMGSTDLVQVVALADRGPGRDRSRGDWQTTKLFHVSQGMLATADNAVVDWGECNMGEPDVLTDFVAWTRANCPARRYVLYFWGHGWSWHPGWVLEDETNNGTLDLDELESALPSLGFIDMVGYDACNMAAIEVQYLWHGNATAVAASQEWVGWNGIEYDGVIALLNAEPSVSADRVAIATSEGTMEDLTWSAVAVDERFDALVTAVDQWAAALQDGLARYRTAYQGAFAATQSFEEAPMDKDLFDMAHEIDRAVSDTAIQAHCRQVMGAVDAVVLHEHHGPAYTGAHGITIYHPEVDWTTDSDNTYYRTLGFALATSWDEFLDAWHAGSVGKAPDRSYPTRRSLQADGRAPPGSIAAAHGQRSAE